MKHYGTPTGRPSQTASPLVSRIDPQDGHVVTIPGGECISSHNFSLLTRQPDIQPAPLSPDPVVWLAPQADLQLDPDALHIWLGDLTCFDEGSLAGVIPAVEFERASRLAMPGDRRRFLLGRVMLRTLLTEYLHHPPRDFVIEFQSKGKPFLTAPEAVEFNLAHSGNAVLLALTYDTPVGVDLEYSGRTSAFDRLARRYFTNRERRAVERSDAGAGRAFLRVWVRKEAALKGDGFGLTVPLNSVDTAPDELRDSRVEVEVGSGADLVVWDVRDVDVSPDYPAAVATRRPLPRTELLHWLPERFGL